MEKKVHLIFSVVMSAFMIFIMSFVVTYMNIGWTEQTVDKWLTSFVYAWVLVFRCCLFLRLSLKKQL